MWQTAVSPSAPIPIQSWFKEQPPAGWLLLADLPILLFLFGWPYTRAASFSSLIKNVLYAIEVYRLLLN